jgi:hypothetical protein
MPQDAATWFHPPSVDNLTIIDDPNGGSKLRYHNLLHCKTLLYYCTALLCINVSWPRLRKHYSTVTKLGAHTGCGFSIPSWLFFLHVLPDKHTLISVSEMSFIIWISAQKDQHIQQNPTTTTLVPNFLIVDLLVLTNLSKSLKIYSAMAS